MYKFAEKKTKFLKLWPKKYSPINLMKSFAIFSQFQAAVSCLSYWSMADMRIFNNHGRKKNFCDYSKKKQVIIAQKNSLNNQN